MIRFAPSDHRLLLSIYVFLIVAWQGVSGCATPPRQNGLVAVLTDFGTTGFYVGAIEGAMCTANARVRIATITHEVEPFDITEGSYLLAQAAREFPRVTDTRFAAAKSTVHPIESPTIDAYHLCTAEVWDRWQHVHSPQVLQDT